MKIKPRVLPRDFLDVLIGLPVGTFQVSLLFFLPSIIVALVFNLLAGAMTYLFIYGVFLLFSVWSITLDANGIRFHRICGSPKHLQWKDIISVEEVTRHEVVLQGWLWPLFPSREMTPSLSTKYHFRIRWADGFCYFQPKDVDQFKNAVSEMMKKIPTEVLDASRKPFDPQR